MPQLINKRRSLTKRISLQQQENKELKAKLAKLQALANLGKVSAIVAHEINNILMPLGNYAQAALNYPQDQALTEKALKKTIQNSARASEILESIMAMVNGESAEIRRCRLLNIVKEVFSSIGRDFSKDKIKVNLEIPEDMNVDVIPVQFQQVIMNLILNAHDAMKPHGGILTVKACQEKNKAIIIIADTGTGISPENIEKIFEPFFTTKTIESQAERTGSGLGLAFCMDIIEAHNGTMAVQSERGQGTEFKITLPLKD
ncbi:MAG: HAMP domain-containing histidine kinase [Sedimentisphaerales bacterium]|nr:HAMP domain-containing histidine kinase [Sedimentisphaerales bacterium]